MISPSAYKFNGSKNLLFELLPEMILLHEGQFLIFLLIHLLHIGCPQSNNKGIKVPFDIDPLRFKFDRSVTIMKDLLILI